MRLTREIRGSPDDARQGIAPRRPLNTWAGSAGGDALSAFWRLRATAEGTPDPKTGYLCDIREMDDLLRRHAIVEIAHRIQERDHAARALASALEIVRNLAPHKVEIIALELAVTPFTQYAAFWKEREIVPTLTRQFEFSASHRLFVEGLGDDENRRIFGKCSNPHGHGHNYVVEVTIAARSGDSPADPLSLEVFDRVVGETVIEPFDHKNLNVEVPEFENLNPSVENIARVIFQRLDAALPDGSLENVRVYETPKTWADCARER